ncbi:MAG: hypothetical protein JWN70_1352, partial [Planctomycetaceae bacterium]|nr:hypothetical protein [Planctomycetaceae bacterium]
MKRTQSCLLAGVILLLASLANGQTKLSVRNVLTKPRPDVTAQFFSDPQVRKLKIEISPAELEKLRADNRKYVRCDLMENGQVTYKGVAIKLKGAAGSFREFDDRPALTFNMDRFTKKQTFHGLEKFHLNNSVQDESYLNELLCSELFREAGQPAPRITHARVWLNDRDVGLYVLKEGFDKRFLKRYFTDEMGNLYDGGFCQDIDADLEKDSGTGPDDRSDLQALRDACADPDRDSRWARLGKLVDIDKFIEFMALELMTCHWDGYTQSKNNYRLYFDPQTKKSHFLAHGMDQMFGDSGFPILNHPPATVASAVMHNPVWREKYRVRLKLLLPLFAPPTKLITRVDVVHQRLLPVFKEMGDDQASAFTDRVNELKQRLIDRAANLQEQVELPDPGPLEFSEKGFAELPEWHPASESEDAVHEQPELDGALATYLIQCGPSGSCVASWRRTVLLGPGRYELEMKVKTEKVVPKEDEKGSGVGLRIS